MIDFELFGGDMNIEEKQKRLKDALEKNIKHENVGIAIAITGSWGVGKTYFWNEFLKDVTHKELEDKKNLYYEASRVDYKSIFDCRKYAYISLFGIENLSDLKNAICTKLALNPYAKSDTSKWEFSQIIKNTVAQFRDIKVSQYGVIASAKILESLLFLQVKDAIICFDDFERISNKLDIKDVMGLANQLKLEKNCQIILILDEDKAESENKEKYAKYKEKLIDDTIIINSVEPLIRENAKDIEEQLIELMAVFADGLEIHNFRFFHKVIKLYREFRDQLPNEVAYSTKEVILIRVLQGYFITDFGSKYEYSWQDINYTVEERRTDWSVTKLKTHKFLENFHFYFIQMDKWGEEFKKWFEQKEIIDISIFHELANSELISENNNNVKEELRKLMKQWRNLQVDQDYCENLFQKSYDSIAFNDLESLDFHCFLLKRFGRNDLSKTLKKEIIIWLDSSLRGNITKNFENAFNFGYKKENIFHWYIKRWKLNNPLLGLYSLFDVLKVYILDGGVKHRAALVLQGATLKDWEEFIFIQSSVDSELKEFTKGELLQEILKQNIDKNAMPLIKKTIEKILLDKLKNSTNINQIKNIEFMIDNFKKNGLL